MEQEIFLEICQQDVDNIYLAPVETLIALFTIKYCDSKIKITLIKTNKKSNDHHNFMININDFTVDILENNETTRSVGYCQLPYLRLNKNSFIAGLCACLRQIIKLTISENSSHHCQNLLGFKNSCLAAPSETSVWTKFCEVDLINMLYNCNEKTRSKVELPEALARYEIHLSQPVRLHNIHKYTMSKKYSPNGVSTQNRNIPEHIYAEGTFMTLADIDIFICIHLFVIFMSNDKIFNAMPLVTKWYNKIMEDENIKSLLNIFPMIIKSSDIDVNFVLPNVIDQSLYQCDPKFYKTGRQAFTKQGDIDLSLDIIKNIGIKYNLEDEPFGVELNIDWNKIPFDAGPNELPKKRLQRKYEQLENLCKATLKLAKSGDKIVDFCAGTAHLGILVAYLRQDCRIIILENKEESLNRAKLRVEKLNLHNIDFYQCNLDYFKGNFDIGLSLHACGVATDLVIQHCLHVNAIFISCPCCYGSIKNCHNIQYPRSKIFRDSISLKNYLTLGHSADQTHDDRNHKTKQGYQCMSIIDTDRKLQAEEFDYKVHLSKLVPDTCTPKNHLLVGIPEFKLADDKTIADYFNNLCNIQQ